MPACRCCRWSLARKETRRQILLYTLLLVPVSLAPWLIGFSGPVYGVRSVVARWRGFLAARACGARPSGRDAGVSLTRDAPAKAAFKFSILYLFLLFSALAVDRLVG